MHAITAGLAVGGVVERAQESAHLLSVFLELLQRPALPTAHLQATLPALLQSVGALRLACKAWHPPLPGVHHSQSVPGGGWGNLPQPSISAVRGATGVRAGSPMPLTSESSAKAVPLRPELTGVAEVHALAHVLHLQGDAVELLVRRMLQPASFPGALAATAPASMPVEAVPRVKGSAVAVVGSGVVRDPRAAPEALREINGNPAGRGTACRQP
eukprot:RCo038525